MAETNGTFIAHESILTPRSLGRTGRFVAGLAAFGYAVFLLSNAYFMFGGSRFLLHPGTLLGIASSLWVVNDLINAGYLRNWGNRPRLVVLGLALVLLLVDLLVYGTPLAPPLSLFVYWFIVYTMAHLGIVHILAALIATPGCEMRSIAHWTNRILGRQTEPRMCTGLWTQVDRWEAGLQHK